MKATPQLTGSPKGNKKDLLEAMTLETQDNPFPTHRRGEEADPKGRYFKIRNWLNLIFIVGAVAGMATYFFAGHTVGSVIIICAMVFKVAECCLRLMR